MNLSSSTPPPLALTIAGSDSSGGAGIQADLKTFAAHEVYGLSAIAAITAQRPGRVVGFEAVSAELLRDQLEVLFEAFSLGAIKTGMLANAELVGVVCDFLEIADPTGKIPLVVDPVMIATAGDSLLDPTAVEIYRERLLPRATVSTPNLPEALALLARDSVDSAEAFEELARDYVSRFNSPVFLKGGHFSKADTCVDLLATSDGVEAFSAPRIEIPGHEIGGLHGSGCTLASAVAARLARGKSLSLACGGAKGYLTRSIIERCYLSKTHEYPALNHFPSPQ